MAEVIHIYAIFSERVPRKEGKGDILMNERIKNCCILKSKYIVLCEDANFM
jgi:hypothetical protein